MRDTDYATEIATAEHNHCRIERIYVKEERRDEIRFSWWPDARMAVRPLDLPEEELLPLMQEAFRVGVFKVEFLRGLKLALDDHLGRRDQIAPPAIREARSMDNATLARRLALLAAWGALAILIFGESLDPPYAYSVDPLERQLRHMWAGGIGLFLFAGVGGSSLAYLSLVVRKLGTLFEAAASILLVAFVGMAAYALVT